MFSRGLAARHAVTSTTESPKRTMTEPSACLASLPVSKERVLEPIWTSRVCIRAWSVGSVRSVGSIRSVGSARSGQVGRVGRVSDPLYPLDPFDLLDPDLLPYAELADELRVAL